VELRDEPVEDCVGGAGGMRISRIKIENFRNFYDLDVELGEHAVIVGENGVGKSNLIHALRLVLDPSLPEAARHLRLEDFWDGLERPLGDDRISIAIDLADFEDNEGQLALLADYLVQPVPMVARLTYVFGKAEGATSSASPEDYVWRIFGGDREEHRVSHEVRRRLPMDLVPALRDAESDLATWRRSPMRLLLERAWAEVDEDAKEELATAIHEAAEGIAAVDSIETLASTVSATMGKLLGREDAELLRLGLGSTDTERLVRSLRLLIGAAQRDLSEASLGFANALYFALKLLELRSLSEADRREYTFLAIEEPEAHLHPHMQRQVFRSFLRLRPHLTSGKTGDLEIPASVLMTTHSPHVASVAPVGTLVLLHQAYADAKGNRLATFGDTVKSNAWPEKDQRDVERYLEVTRAEVLFAKGVILVEGIAEVYLVPHVARHLGHNLDALGISVCSVEGTHFYVIARLLKELAVPFVVVTDLDPQWDDDGDEIASLAEGRVEKLLALFGDYDDPDTFWDDAKENGIFVGNHTLEIDLLKEGADALVLTTLLALGGTKPARARAKQWEAIDVEDIPVEDVLKDVTAIGKGRFAQHLGSLLGELDPDLQNAGPDYIVSAIKHLVKQVR
jgi:putative ATP-dependent endonuclease of the OLD family